MIKVNLLKTIYSTIILYLKYYKDIKLNKKLANNYKGNVYLLGSGPSMKNLDLSSLKNENCIFLNNFVAHPSFSKITANSTNKEFSNFYLIAPIHPPQTKDLWLLWLKEIDAKVPDDMIMVFGINARNMNTKSIVERNNLFRKNKIYYFYAGNYSENIKPSKIDMSKNVIGSETVSLYAIYFSLYLGFNEINLLGMDHNYLLYDKTSEMRMFESATHQDGSGNDGFASENMYKEYLRQYKIFKKYTKLNILYPNRIFNYTRGGLLNIFKRKNFSE